MASSIVFVCGPNLCRLDPKTGKTTALTRDGQSGRHGRAYGSPSLSRDGRQLAFIYANDLFVARSDGSRRRRLDRGPFLAYLSPDGRQVAYSRSIYDLISPATFYPTYSPAVYGLLPYLFVRPLTGGKRTTVARSVISVGWLGGRLLREDTPSGGKPDRICVLKTNRDYPCAHVVAVQPGFDVSGPAGSPDGRTVVAVAEPHSSAPGLRRRFAGRIGLFRAADGRLVRFLTRGRDDSAPVFSPDGRLVAFSRGRDLYVVSARGGRTRLLRRGATHPTWGAR